MMSKKSNEYQPMLFAVDSPVRTYLWPESARAWLESGADCGLSSIALSSAISRDGLSSKMSPAFYLPTKAGTLPPSFAGWSSAGMASVGGFWTLSISDSPSAVVACSLSEVLEADVPLRYYLSPRACRGILRRAERRGKKLPPYLERSLRAVAERPDLEDKGQS